MNEERYDWFQREGIALLTDFYELTMMAGYLAEGRAEQRVCFEYFFRELPHDSGFAVSAGLGPLIDYLDHLRFMPSDIEYLRSLNTFQEDFLERLARFRPRFTMRAIAEGTLVFPHEPVVQLEGSIFETQLVESAVLNFLNYQTLIATKAARICLAANHEPVLEFGLRRAHGPDGSVSGSRAAYIGGCNSTSNVLAGKIYGVPVSGTHAHSWVMSFPNELDAFRSFVRLYPGGVLLVDTYDTIESGVPNAITALTEMREMGHDLRAAIRLDSGDLAKLSKAAYELLTAAGWDDPLIVASNELDEDLIADLKRQGAKINAWGVGTQLITSYDAPALGGVYKLTAVETDGAWEPRLKISSNIEKATDPGLKQVVRYYDSNDHPLGDVLYLLDESWSESGTVPATKRVMPNLPAHIRNAARAEALLQPVFENGKRVAPAAPVQEIRAHARRQIDRMPEEYRRLRNPEVYNVLLSPRLGALKESLLIDLLR